MSPRDRNLAAQIGCLAPAKDFSAQDIALGAEQMVAENKLDFLRQHLTGGIGRGTPDLQLQLDAAFFRDVFDDGVPVSSSLADIPLVDR